MPQANKTSKQKRALPAVLGAAGLSLSLASTTNSRVFFSSTQELASGFSGRPRRLAGSDSRSAAASRSITDDDSGLSR
jgi:hypothetical protein